MVTKTKYDPFIDCISVGNWCNFNDLSSDVRSMEINPAAGVYDTGELFTEEDLVPDTIKGYMNIPDGELPKFKEGPFAKFPDFRLAVRHWMAYNASLGNQGNPEGNVSVSFTVGKDGKAKDAKVETGRPHRPNWKLQHYIPSNDFPNLYLPPKTENPWHSA